MGLKGFLIKLLSSKNLFSKKQDKVKLWMRMGVTFEVNAHEARKILSGDSTALDTAMKAKGSWYFDGDSYIPDIVVEELCEELCLNHEDYKGEISFDVGRGGNYGA